MEYEKREERKERGGEGRGREGRKKGGREEGGGREGGNHTYTTTKSFLCGPHAPEYVGAHWAAGARGGKTEVSSSITL